MLNTEMTAESGD